MDNSNNSFEKNTDGVTRPACEGDGALNPHRHLQRKYPTPPEWTKNIVISEKPWIPSDEKGNVSVQFNEPEKTSPEIPEEEEEEQEIKKELPMWQQITIVSVIALITVLLSVSIIRGEKNDKGVISSLQTPTTAYSVAGTVAPTSPASSDKVTTEKTTVSSDSEKISSAAPEDSGASSLADSKDEAEEKKKIVKYFNECSNRVKKEAVKVVKNFENRTHNEDKLSLPSAIKGVAQNVLESKITDITEPVEYPSREAIIARYPAPGEEWSANLDPEDVEKAIRMEKGDEYEITLLLKDCVDPEPGKGTSKAMDCLDVPTVRDTAPEFITDFSAEYYECIIRCRVEKKTGRVVWSNYTTPVLIKIGLDAGFVEFDAEIGLTFEKDYTITY